MKKTVAFIMALMMSVSAFTGCKNKEESSSEEESSILEVMIPLEMPDIEIEIPDSYEMTSTQNNNTVYVKEDASVIVNSDDFTEDYDTLDEFVNFAEGAYREYSDGIEILSKEKRSENCVVLEYIYSLVSVDGVFRKYNMVGFFTDGQKLYLVTCKADEDTYESYREEFLDIIESVNV